EFPVVKDLVLVGGGHSHVAVLKIFGMQPLRGVRVTLICKDIATPYSGMIPGYIAGHYTFEEAHIDLRPLCQFAGATFIHAAAIGLNLENRHVLCEGRPAISFDVLSINTGSTPRVRGIPGATASAVRVKPIASFVRTWEELVRELKQSPQRTFRIVVVGGGAGGVELTLATRHRLREELDGTDPGAPGIEFHLVSDARTLLPTHNARVQRKFARILDERGVHVHLNHRVIEVKPGLLLCGPGAPIPFDRLFWAINAEAPEWIAASGLQTEANGFAAVNDRLQSLSHPFVFAAGDVADVTEHPRPKSGVFAVRQGRPLAINLRRALTGRLLQPFRPQKQFLSLISTGNKYAVASRGPWVLEGERLWRLKDWIDRRWMRQYQELPAMTGNAPPEIESGLADAAAMRELSALTMRCGGCGAKVGSSVLARVLERLRPGSREDIVIGLNSPDDAVVSVVPPGAASVQSVDFFRALVSDSFLFGRIACNHCLGDIFAMGARPQSALALALLPPALEAKLEEQLFQLMAGALQVLTEHNTILAGGHTAEGAELAFGLVVNGLVDPARILRKGGLKPGDRLILTKPLGTGTLFAAEMRRRAKGAWIEAALESMLRSNRVAAECFLRHGATACTDVTGFGLLGHLVEMIRQSGKVAAELRMDAIPVLDGVVETMRAGIFSSMQPQNLRLRRAISNAEAGVRSDRYPVLFDPQTAGGLLGGVPEENAQACLSALRDGGDHEASIIGSVTSPEAEAGLIKLTA
ncbi:MAG: selenide, water dikinase SelD, partial [Verrucomicrobiales bacterium]|nr:selenide, water dikinase SelD [Verrucomicrobiales bacterium]